MRKITQYSYHTYKSKASAMRAARNLIGKTVFIEGHTVVLTVERVSVEQRNDGWCWACTCEIPDSEPVEVVSETPPAAPAPTPAPAVPATMTELVARVEDYKATVQALSNTEAGIYIDRELPGLKAACTALNVTLRDVSEALEMVRGAAYSTDPSWIAKVVVKTSRFGLHHRLERQLSEQAEKRKISAEYYLQSANNSLQSCAV